VRVSARMLAIATLSLLVVSSGVVAAFAQDVYKVNYFDGNTGSFTPVTYPDPKVRIDNPGLTYGNLCAMIYVFAADQQMAECCGCVETHNGLRKLSILHDLTSNSLTGVIPFNGVIKVISAAVNGNGSSCDPSGNVSPKPNLRVWVTHNNDQYITDYFDTTGKLAFVSTTFPQTETESSDSTLGTTELANLQAQCSFIHILGSGHGICNCGTGD
jgi:hypothetical protein